MSTPTNKRVIAILNMAKLRKINDFIFKAKAIVQDIGNNATIFTTPNPPLATITGHITGLETVQTNVVGKVPGSVENRKPKYDAVLADLRTALLYVQGLADAAATPDLAVSIIAASGFDIRNAGSINKPILSVSYSKTTGKVTLIAKAAEKRASYNWQYATDGGTVWIDLPTTLQAKTTVSDLLLSNKLVFRVMSVTKEGSNNWSDAVAIQ